MAILITSQYDYNYEDQPGNPTSDEILTIPDEDYTIQELMQRAVARTMPDIENDGFYDDIDDEIDFNDLIFSQISNMDDFLAFKEELDYVLERYNTEKTNELVEQEKNKLNQVSPESEENFPHSENENVS